MTTADPAVTTTTAGELLAAVSELGAALRQALAASTSTAADPATLCAAAISVRQAADLLAASPRPRTELSPLDDMARGVRVFNPVVGIGSGIAVPLTMELDGDGVLARAEFGQAFEGPPTLLHGGIAALQMDQVLGYAAIVVDRWGMTVDLQLRYRRPVPLHTPLRLTGRVTATEGRRTTAVGAICTEQEPDVPLVEATAVFVSLSAEVAARYFGSVRTADGAQTTGRLRTGPP